MAAAWLGVDRHSWSLTPSRSPEGGLECVFGAFLNSLMLGPSSLRLGLCSSLSALCSFKAVFLRGLVPHGIRIILVTFLF